MKYSDLKDGMVVKLDEFFAFTCVSPGSHIVFYDEAEDDFFFDCQEGRHWMDGQKSFDGSGEIVGVSRFRWEATVHYFEGPPVTHYIDELEELQDLIERGRDFGDIDQVQIKYAFAEIPEWPYKDLDARREQLAMCRGLVLACTEAVQQGADHVVEPILSSAGVTLQEALEAGCGDYDLKAVSPIMGWDFEPEGED